MAKKSMMDTIYDAQRDILAGALNAAKSIQQKPKTDELTDCCDNPSVTDLTHGRGEVRNFICHNCNAHLYDGKRYTGKEWEAWINS